jgi:hypothetical protein
LRKFPLHYNEEINKKFVLLIYFNIADEWKTIRYQCIAQCFGLKGIRKPNIFQNKTNQCYYHPKTMKGMQ